MADGMAKEGFDGTQEFTPERLVEMGRALLQASNPGLPEKVINEFNILNHLRGIPITPQGITGHQDTVKSIARERMECSVNALSALSKKETLNVEEAYTVYGIVAAAIKWLHPQATNVTGGHKQDFSQFISDHPDFHIQLEASVEKALPIIRDHASTQIIMACNSALGDRGARSPAGA